MSKVTPSITNMMGPTKRAKGMIKAFRNSEVTKMKFTIYIVGK
jgi:hypothetical protein